MKVSKGIQKLLGRTKRDSQPVSWPSELGDDEWTTVKRGSGRQHRGRIYAATRNDHNPVSPNDQNRAGHRAYVRANQPRQVRKNIVGFGRWRRHNESTEESFALQTAIPPMPPRAVRRAEMIAVDVASRRARGRRITP